MDWDERYRGREFFYGKAPNGFLASVADGIPRGHVLTLAEGEGRNAAYLASRGFRVTGVDNSRVGLAKAQALAGERSLVIDTIHADLADFRIEAKSWDGIVACYCHLPPEIRVPLHRAAVRGLKPGGVFVLEAFSKEQLRYNTGGPKSLDMLMSLDDLKRELEGLQLIYAAQVEREVREGIGHTGLASVVQIFGMKPLP